MIDKQKILAKALESSDFEGSDRYQELLKYLVNASETKEFVKESTIAVDVFGKDSSFDPHEDPSIRVYISNLRKKLEHYYFTEGKEDQIRIEIPKGHYHVNFVSIKKDKNKKAMKYKYLSFLLFIPLIVISIIVIIYQRYQLNTNFEESAFTQEHHLWGEYLQKNEDPTLLVLGDYFFLYENKKNVRGGYFVRDPRINSPEEFKQVLKNNPTLIKRFVECNFTYLGPSSAESLTYILPILINSSNKIFVKLSSQFKLEDLNKYNVIFVGSFKTLFDLKEFLQSIPIKYQIFPPKLFLSNKNTDTTLTYKAMNNERASYKKDYGLIIKHLTPENHSLLFFVGFDELGVIEAVKTATDPKFTTILSDSFNVQNYNKPFLFSSVIEVEGIDRSSYNSKIVYFQRLE